MSNDQDRSFRSEEDALAAMRTVWSANAMTAEDLEQFCPTTKICKNVSDLGIKGMDDEAMADDLRSEWKRQLQRDGKVPEDVQSIGDLVASMTEPQQ